MNLDQLNRWLTLVANIGVIMGIVFLAIEINQNQTALEEQNMLTRLSARESNTEMLGEFRYLLLENPDLLQVWEKAQTDEPLTKLESQQFRTMCVERVWGQLAIYNRFVALGETQEAEGAARLVARGPSGSAERGCWDSNKGDILARGHDAFVNAVEAAREKL